MKPLYFVDHVLCVIGCSFLLATSFCLMFLFVYGSSLLLMFTVNYLKMVVCIYNSLISFVLIARSLMISLCFLMICRS